MVYICSVANIVYKDMQYGLQVRLIRANMYKDQQESR